MCMNVFILCTSMLWSQTQGCRGCLYHNDESSKLKGFGHRPTEQKLVVGVVWSLIGSQGSETSRTTVSCSVATYNQHTSPLLSLQSLSEHSGSEQNLTKRDRSVTNSGMLRAELWVCCAQKEIKWLQNTCAPLGAGTPLDKALSGDERCLCVTSSLVIDIVSSVLVLAGLLTGLHTEQCLFFLPHNVSRL